MPNTGSEGRSRLTGIIGALRTPMKDGRARPCWSPAEAQVIDMSLKDPDLL
jgi:hypothetical protein